jgi:hypothetical protein
MEIGKINIDIRDDLKVSIINYNRKNGKRFRQSDIDPTVSPAHINNVASGRGQNKSLRTKIEKFIRKYGKK